MPQQSKILDAIQILLLLCLPFLPFLFFPRSDSAGTLQQLISDTMVRWAQESVIEDPELVRAMFVLLHRQYDGIGGQVSSINTIMLKYTGNGVSQ